MNEYHQPGHHQPNEYSHTLYDPQLGCNHVKLTILYSSRLVHIYTNSNNNGKKNSIYISDPPDITVEKSWVHSGEGFEAQLVCVVHADPQPTVSSSFLHTLFNALIYSKIYMK